MRDRFLKIFFSLALGSGMAALNLIGCGPSASPSSSKAIPSDDSNSSAEEAAANDVLSIESFSDKTSNVRNDTANGQRFPRVEGMQPIADSSPSMESDANTSEQPRQWTAAELEDIGIESFASERLRLLADQVSAREREQFESLPPLLDEYFIWVQEQYPMFLKGAGGAPWQWTGHVMEEPALYRQAGLLPEDIADLTHGRDQGRQFWIVEQPTSYYRQHLILHEATHCLMNERFHQWPVWYLEGMAELLACHQLEAEGRPRFAVTPGGQQVSGGFGRLALIRSEIEAGRFQTLDDVLRLDFDNFYPHKTSYAWSWACCYFLSHHPLTAESFHRLAGIRTNPEFDRTLQQILEQDRPRLDLDWGAFVGSLVPGFDFPRMLATPPDGAESPNRWALQVERSWQASPFLVEQGEVFTVTGNGQFSLASQPQPWTAEAWGISLDYAEGRPLGELQLAIVPEGDAPLRGRYLTIPLSIGGQREVEAANAGRLYFRINDRANNWANNSGEVMIEFQPGPTAGASDAN